MNDQNLEDKILPVDLVTKLEDQLQLKKDELARAQNKVHRMECAMDHIEALIAEFEHD